MNRKDLELGMILGLCLPAKMRVRAAGDAVGYSYNGVVLPQLPEWTKDFPYLYMWENLGYYTLYGFKTMPETVEKTQYLTGKLYDHHRLSEAADWAHDWVRPYNSCQWWGQENNNGDGGNTLTDIFWSNYDILTSAGAVYMAASKPVPVYAGAMCSFNGKVLPQLPEMDRAVYPYRVLVQSFDEGERARWMLYGFAQKPYMWVSTSGDPYYGNEDGAVCCYSTDSKGGFWYSEPAATWTNGSNASAKNLIWADHDVYDENNDLVLEASEPVPV